MNNKPCIALTDFQGRYDTLWFTLMHELCHIIYDFEDLKTNVYHLTGEIDAFRLNEERADFFAREMLFPSDKLDYIKPIIESKNIVEQYAEKNSIHPSIIYGFYLRDLSKTKQKAEYPKYRRHLINSDVALKSIKFNIWAEENINAIVSKIKSKLVINEQ